MNLNALGKLFLGSVTAYAAKQIFFSGEEETKEEVNLTPAEMARRIILDPNSSAEDRWIRFNRFLDGSNFKTASYQQRCFLWTSVLNGTG